MSRDDRQYGSVADFLEDWVNLRPVTFFEIRCKVDKARQNCQKEIRQLERRGVLTVEPHRFGQREIPTYKLKRRGVSEELRIRAEHFKVRE